MKEDDKDYIRSDGVQQCLNEQKQKIEQAKLVQKRPEPQALDEEVEEIRIEAEEKISSMKNKVEADYCKDDDSIATIENEF